MLTADEIRFFDEFGYLILRDRIPSDLLRRLQDGADRWIARGRHGDVGDADPNDFCFADRPDGRTFFRVDYLHDKGEAVSLELLGSPAILEIAASLAGPNFVPTYESMVFKDEGDGAPIKWHQDAVHPRTSRIFNIDVYLDASTADGGALRVLPGSQREPADICRIEQLHGWEPPETVVAEMAPGDVLVHDVMIVHGSPPVQGNRLRRTLYYEFRAAEQILAEGPWDRDWITERLRLLPLGLAAHAEAHPDAPQFAWQIDPSLRPAAPADRLRVYHDAHSPGTYCSAGDVPVAV